MKRILIIVFCALYSLPSSCSQHLYEIAGRQFACVQGDITMQDTDAIVNAANSGLAGGTGVCGAIFNAAGWNDLQEKCNKIPLENGVRCPAGEARITDSCGLKKTDSEEPGVTYIIHAVGPDCRIAQQNNDRKNLLTGAYSNSFTIAQGNDLESVSFPFISSAIFAYPNDEAADVAIETLVNCLETRSGSIKQVRMVLFSQDHFDLFIKKLDKNKKLKKIDSEENQNATTWDEAQKQWDDKHSSSTPKSAYVRTGLALAGVATIGVAGKKLSNAIDFSQIKKYVKEKTTDSAHWVSELSTTKKVVAGASLVTAVSLGAWALITKWSKRKQAQQKPVTQLQSSLKKETITSLTDKGVDVVQLFQDAAEDSTILYHNNTFYQSLDLDQKTLVNRAIEDHLKENPFYQEE